MDCPVCGYAMQPLDNNCPRCARHAAKGVTPAKLTPTSRPVAPPSVMQGVNRLAAGIFVALIVGVSIGFAARSIQTTPVAPAAASTVRVVSPTSSPGTIPRPTSSYSASTYRPTATVASSTPTPRPQPQQPRQSQQQQAEEQARLDTLRRGNAELESQMAELQRFNDRLAELEAQKAAGDLDIERAKMDETVTSADLYRKGMAVADISAKMSEVYNEKLKYLEAHRK